MLIEQRLVIRPHGKGESAVSRYLRRPCYVKAEDNRETDAGLLVPNTIVTQQRRPKLQKGTKPDIWPSFGNTKTTASSKFSLSIAKIFPNRTDKLLYFLLTYARWWTVCVISLLELDNEIRLRWMSDFN